MSPVSEGRRIYLNTGKFISSIAPGAQVTMRSKGVLSSLTIAQAALESGWGVHAPGNNLFGIKAYGWNGPTQILKTTEYIGGKTVTISDVFRVYSSWAASVEDHAEFLVKNSRYKNIIGVSDFKKVCSLIQEDGYATEQDYAQQLINLITNYKLYTYDTLPALTCIDTPIQGATINSKFGVSGWALNFSGIARVDVYADKSLGLASIRTFAARPDVSAAANPFGWYKNAGSSGFSCVIPQRKIASGKHTIDCAGIGQDGSVMWASKSILIR